MIFAERRKVVTSYGEWLDENKKHGMPLANCPETFLAYLDNHGYIKQKEVKDYKTLWNKLYICINDLQYTIAPDDNMENDIDKYVRIEECDMLQQILDTMLEMEHKEGDT